MEAHEVGEDTTGFTLAPHREMNRLGGFSANQALMVSR
jgi:hypothetical protein